MKIASGVGIVGFGAYIPLHRLKSEIVADQWGRSRKCVPVEEKSVPAMDEDSITMAIEAGRNALNRAGIAAGSIGGVWVGSESKPYAVKPSATVVAEALGVTPLTLASDIEFACKAGTEAMQVGFGTVGSGMLDYGLAVGVDTAQSRPGDELEYTTGAGAAAFITGKADEAVAVLEASVSVVTDTPDFFRRAHQLFPEHGNRFTGQPAYFQHTREATLQILEELGAEPGDFHHVVFHQPRPKFPREIAREMGFTQQQIEAGLVGRRIGNAYAASSPIGLAAVLDVAEPGMRILMVSFGSGAGSDAFSFKVTDRITQVRDRAPMVEDYLQRRQLIPDYGTYMRNIHRIMVD